jgi:hypothetical protein
MAYLMIFTTITKIFKTSRRLENVATFQYQTPFFPSLNICLISLKILYSSVDLIVKQISCLKILTWFNKFSIGLMHNFQW